MICRQEKGNAKFRSFRNLICRYFAQTTSMYGSFHETKERFIYTGQQTTRRFLSSTRNNKNSRRTKKCTLFTSVWTGNATIHSQKYYSRTDQQNCILCCHGHSDVFWVYSQIHRYWIHACALEHVLGGVLLEHGGWALRVHKYFRHVLVDTEEVDDLFQGK